MSRNSGLVRWLQRIWRRWPRRLVLRGSGVAVELLYVEEDAAGARYRVRLPDGQERFVPRQALASRPRAFGWLMLVLVVAVLLGSFAGLGPERVDALLAEAEAGLAALRALLALSPAPSAG